MRNLQGRMLHLAQGEGEHSLLHSILCEVDVPQPVSEFIAHHSVYCCGNLRRALPSILPAYVWRIRRRQRPFYHATCVRECTYASSHWQANLYHIAVNRCWPAIHTSQKSSLDSRFETDIAMRSNWCGIYKFEAQTSCRYGIYTIYRHGLSSRGLY
jgi:hypothetical protein